MLSDDYREIYEALDNWFGTTEFIANKLKVDQSNANRKLNDLHELGIVERERYGFPDNAHFFIYTVSEDAEADFEFEFDIDRFYKQKLEDDVSVNAEILDILTVDEPETAYNPGGRTHTATDLADRIDRKISNTVRRLNYLEEQDLVNFSKVLSGGQPEKRWYRSDDYDPWILEPENQSEEQSPRMLESTETGKNYTD